MDIVIDGIDFSKTLGPWIARTYKMMDCYMESVLIENNISITKQQWFVLNLVQTNDGINQNELAVFINRDKTSVTRFVSTLLKRGFLEKKNCLKDKRANTLHITKSGLQIVKETTPIVKEAVLKLQNELSTEEIKLAISSLKKIQEKITQINK